MLRTKVTECILIPYWGALSYDMAQIRCHSNLIILGAKLPEVHSVRARDKILKDKVSLEEAIAIIAKNKPDCKQQFEWVQFFNFFGVADETLSNSQSLIMAPNFPTPAYQWYAGPLWKWYAFNDGAHKLMLIDKPLEISTCLVLTIKRNITMVALIMKTSGTKGSRSWRKFWPRVILSKCSSTFPLEFLRGAL